MSASRLHAEFDDVSKRDLELDCKPVRPTHLNTNGGRVEARKSLDEPPNRIGPESVPRARFQII